MQMQCLCFDFEFGSWFFFGGRKTTFRAKETKLSRKYMKLFQKKKHRKAGLREMEIVKRMREALS